MNIKTLFLGLISAAAMTACSNIADDERLIFVEHKDVPTNPDDEGDKDGMSFTSTVLVEDFTGQRCTWCPSGAREIEKQIELMGEDRVIPVAIHCGLAIPVQRGGLWSELGTYYYTAAGEPSQPAARFNRTKLSNEREQWGQLIWEPLTGVADVAMDINATYDADTRTVTMDIRHKTYENPVAGNLQVWLTESGIVRRQVDNGEEIADYVHNHVLREAINGNDGQAVSLTKDVTTTTISYVIPETYVAENCEIVAFVYNANGVLQTTKSKVIK